MSLYEFFTIHEEYGQNNEVEPNANGSESDCDEEFFSTVSSKDLFGVGRKVKPFCHSQEQPFHVPHDFNVNQSYAHDLLPLISGENYIQNSIPTQMKFPEVQNMRENYTIPQFQFAPRINFSKPQIPCEPPKRNFPVSSFPLAPRMNFLKSRRTFERQKRLSVPRMVYTSSQTVPRKRNISVAQPRMNFSASSVSQPSFNGNDGNVVHIKESIKGILENHHHFDLVVEKRKYQILFFSLNKILKFINLPKNLIISLSVEHNGKNHEYDIKDNIIKFKTLYKFLTKAIGRNVNKNTKKGSLKKKFFKFTFLLKLDGKKAVFAPKRNVLIYSDRSIFNFSPQLDGAKKGYTSQYVVYE